MRVLFVAAALVGSLTGQEAPRTAFDVASIKLHPPGTPMVPDFGVSVSGTRVAVRDYSIGGIIEYAYDLQPYQLAPWPKGSDNSICDIDARIEGERPLSIDQVRTMLRSLLADRFNLRFHREMKETAVYALVTGKDGPKFKESAQDRLRNITQSTGRIFQGALTGATIGDLCIYLSVTGLNDGRAVVDRTGLSSEGKYDMKFEFTPDFISDKNPDPGDISIFSAVQDQLGLKLEPRKMQIEMFVVDRVDKPSGN